MKYIDKLIFNEATVRKEEYEFLVEYIKQHNIKSVLEFGPGVSTYAFLENDCHVVSLEHTDWFFEKFSKEFSNTGNVHIVKFENKPVLEWDMDETFDMAFIDTPPGVGRIFSRLNSVMFASKYTKRILMHDSRRIGEIMTQQVMTELGWKVMEVCPGYTGICEMTI